MTSKEIPIKKVGLLFTEVAMGLLDYKFFDLDGMPVNDLQCLTKFNRDEDDYTEDEKDLVNILRISKQNLTSKINPQIITDTIDLDNADEIDHDLNRNNSKNQEIQNEKKSVTQSEEHIKEKPIGIAENIKKQETKKNLSDQNLISTEQQLIPIDEEDPDPDGISKEKPDPLLIKSNLKQERVKYLTELTNYELARIQKAAFKRKKEYLNAIFSKNKNKNLDDFYREEKKRYEIESDALISFIKVVKKAEFPPNDPKLVKLVTQISGDIMEAKNNIETMTFFKHD